ncbi:DUF6412 domain-containing protein [Agromyces sp. SYSU K20354]|uniref:DUF6412 domain-containing protein n=1 Tax=Agromyces cavernae TaxID=2898659 RepID=UPI001E3EC2D5|nr:DUF6412 domain-containing protein [Agromyces cavernae]MCD2441593.1 DUF6412 domain-containing protein [Agromyces cavernae]
MIELVTEFLRFTQASFELAVASNAHLAVLLLGVVGAAAVAVIVTTCRALPALVAADSSDASTRFRQTADPWRLLAQSDPDAPGRPRPRAPGRGIPAA